MLIRFRSILIPLILLAFLDTDNLSAFADAHPVAEPPPPWKRVLVIDAGSSGTRVIEYTLTNTGTPEQPLYDLDRQSRMLESHRLTQGEPFQPEIHRFISNVFASNDSSLSPIAFFLGATAGLRSTDRNTARLILSEKVEEITESGGTAQYNDNVLLLSGLDEGSFTWFGLNFISRASRNEASLMDRIRRMVTRSPEQIGIIEMGGGSVQLAFMIPQGFKATELERDDGVNPAAAHVRQFSFPGDVTLDIYSDSHPGKGLNFAYQEIITLFLDHPETNPCLNRGYSFRDEITGELYSTYGNYQRCRSVIDSALFSGFQPSFQHSLTPDSEYLEILPRQFFLTGYFYDLAYATGLPSKFTPQHLEDFACFVCNRHFSALNITSPENGWVHSYFIHNNTSLVHNSIDDFQQQGGKLRKFATSQYCTLLTYTALLLNRIGLPPDLEVYTQKGQTYRNQSYGISWPLGYAILSVNNWL